MPSTDPYTRAATLLVRLVAFAFVLFSALYLLYTWYDRKGSGLLPLKYFMGGFFLIIGFVMLVKSNAIARSITQDHDGEDGQDEPPEPP